MSDEKQKRPYKRREMLVDPKLQIRLPLKIIGCIYFYALILGALINAPAIWELFTAAPESAEHTWAIRQMIGLLKFLVVPVALTFILAMHGLAISHRFAGPLVRFKKALKSMAEGERPELIYLRKKDHLKDLAEEFNVAISALNKENADLRRMNFEAMHQASQLLDLIRDDESNRVDMALAAQNVFEATTRVDSRLGGPGGLETLSADDEAEADDEVEEHGAESNNGVENPEPELEAV